MNFNSIWKSYLNEDREAQLLLEARVKDIKAKYSEWNRLGLIDKARSLIEEVLGPKGVSKYLLYWVREMERQFEIQAEFEEGESPDVVMPDIEEVGTVVLDLIVKFQQNQQRLEEKDIYKYNINQLQTAMGRLGLSSRERREKKKEEAMEGSEIVYDDNDIFAVRPFTEEASCYYGQRTRWCISATLSRNYFSQYTQDGKGFVMARLENLPEDHEYKKIALVFDRDGSFDEAYDAEDNPIGYVEVRSALALNNRRTGMNPYRDLDEEEQEEIDNLTSDLISYGEQNIMSNPPDPGEDYEKEIEELESTYADRIEHAYFSAEVDDYGEGSYVLFSGGFEVTVDRERLKHDFPEDWRTQSLLTRELGDALNNISIWPEEVDIYDNHITVRMSTGDYNPNPDGYEEFLSNLEDADEKYASIVRAIEKTLMIEGYLETSALDKLSDELDDFGPELKNFVISSDEDVGDEEIVFTTKGLMSVGSEVEMNAKEVLNRLPEVQKDAGFFTETGYHRYRSQEVTKLAISQLRDLHTKITQYLEKQLELPISDLPSRVVKELTIPEFLNIILFAPARDAHLEKIKFHIEIKMEDFSISQEAVDATKEVIKFIDNNIWKVEDAVNGAIVQILEKTRVAERQQTERLSKYAKNLLKIMQHFRRLDNRVEHFADFIDDWKLARRGITDAHAEEALRRLHALAKEKNMVPEDAVMPSIFAASEPPEALQIDESLGLYSEINNYFGINEEKGRSRQRGIYKFYCMIGYAIEGGDKKRGLDDILADVRAIPNVTIVTVVVSNRRIAEQRYISGLSIKFIPSIPGQVSSPEDTKARILRDIRRVPNLERIFKVSTSVERIE